MFFCGVRHGLIGALVILALIYAERSNASAGISAEPAGTDIHEILRTSSGEYFIGTNGGLSLWIGPGQYRNYTVYDGLVANLIYDLAEDDKGRVWVATEGGISIFTKGNFTNFPCGSGFMHSGAVRLKWKNGKMIVHTASEGTLIFEGDNITKIPPPEILPAKKKKDIKSRPAPVIIHSRQPDYEGNEWKKVLGQGMPALYPTNYIRFQTPIKNKYAKNISEKLADSIMAMIPAGKSGSFWFVTNDKKLRHFDISKGKIADPNFDIDEDVRVTGLARTSDNYLWIIAENRIFRIDDREPETSSPKAVPYEGVGKIRTMIEEEKITWFLAENGLLKYKDNTLETYTYRDGLPPGPILAIQRDAENNLWAGGPGGFGKLILGEGRKSLNDVEKAVRRAEQSSVRKGFNHSRKEYEDAARHLALMDTRNLKVLILSARVEYHLASKDCPPIGWQLKSPYLADSCADYESGKCNIVSKPVSALKFRKKSEEDQDDLDYQPLLRPFLQIKRNQDINAFNSKMLSESIQKQNAKFSAVIRPLRAALNLNPDNKMLWLEYGNALLMNREWEDVQEAIDIFKKSDFANDKHFLNNLGVAYAMSGQYEYARKLFQQIKTDDPHYLPALFNLVRLLHIEKKYNESEILARTYLESDHSDSLWRQASEKLLESVQQENDWHVSAKLAVLFIGLTGIASLLGYIRRFGSIWRDVKRNIPFAPIKNPYIVGNPIRSSEMFFGRKDDFFFIRQKLKGDEKNLVIVFCGERRSGKTSILFQILNGRLGHGFIPVLFDMQSVPLVKSEADFLQKMAEETLSSTGHPEWLDEFQWHGQDINPFQTYETLLNRITEIHPSDYLLYLFDEYEIIGEKVREGSLSHDLIFFFANLLENRKISFIFTGSKRIEDHSENFWKILIGKSVYKKISFLSVRDTERLITEPVQESLFYEEGIVELITAYSAGSPFYTQVICQNLTDRANMKRTSYVDKKDLEAIIEEVLDNPLPQMIYFWDNLPYEEKLVLSLLAEALEKHNQSLRPKVLLGLVQKEKIPVSLNYQEFLTVSERLFHKEILLKDSRGRYRFRTDLFRRWIGKDHSIWEVIHNSQVAK